MSISGDIRRSRELLEDLLKVSKESHDLLKIIADSLAEQKITGIVVKQNLGGSKVAKAKCKVAKGGPGMKAAAKAGPTTKFAAGTFTLLDNGTGSFTTLGVDESGGNVDISGVATEAVVSADANLTVDPPAGMTVIIHAPASGAGTGHVTWTATWNDGSVGPYTFEGDVSYSGGNVTGITVVQNP